MRQATLRVRVLSAASASAAQISSWSLTFSSSSSSLPLHLLLLLCHSPVGAVVVGLVSFATTVLLVYYFKSFYYCR